MNKCPQCSNDLSADVGVCKACGFPIAEDVTETLSMLGLDETRATRILSDKSMTPEMWQKIKNLFEAAQTLAPEKRGRFLENACGDDNLKKEVEKLLGSFDEAESFLEKPAVAEAASMFENKNSGCSSYDRKLTRRTTRCRNCFSEPLPCISCLILLCFIQT